MEYCKSNEKGEKFKNIKHLNSYQHFSQIGLHLHVANQYDQKEKCLFKMILLEFLIQSDFFKS